MKYGKALKWNELADLYPGAAQTKPMWQVFEWAANQKGRFYVHPERGTIHLIKKENKNRKKRR